MVRRLLILAACFVVVAVLLAGSFVRVREAEVGLSGSSVLATGWHLRLPFAPVARVAREGEVTLEPVEAGTARGQPRRLSVRLSYRLSPAVDGVLLSSVPREGLAEPLRGLLGPALSRALRSQDSARLGRSGSAIDAIGSALAAELRGRGIEVTDLEWRRIETSQGPPVAPLVAARRQKLLVLGLDAADWQIAAPLMQAGRMPNLARLIGLGAAGSLRSYAPMISPLIWTTMVTGTGPDEHGIADFLVHDGTTKKGVPISSRFRRVKALWNILSDAGLTSGFVGFWATHPAEPVRGIMVSELLGFSLMRPGGGAGQEGASAGITYPESYYAEILPRLVRPTDVTYEQVTRMLHVSRQEFDSAIDIPPPEKPKRGEPPHVQDPVWLVRKTIAITANYETIAADMLRRDLDLVAVYFEGIDMVGHRFQHCMPPRMAQCPDAEYEKERDAVAAFYEMQDEMIGRLVALAPGRTVIVLSDHGFRNGDDRPPHMLPYTTNQPVEWHREHGLVVISGPVTRAGSVLDRPSVYDIAPTVIYLAGLPVARDMRGRVLTDALDPAFLADSPPKWIDSYEEMGTPLSTITASLAPTSSEAQEEMIRNLKALGYVGADSPVPQAGRETVPEADAGRPEEGRVEAAGAGVSESGEPGETTRVMYHRNLATWLMNEGQNDEAEVELLRANRIEPLPKTYEMISEIRAGRGDIEGAAGVLEEGLEKFKEMDEESILWIVELRVGQGRPELAEQALARWRGRMKRPAILSTCEGKIAAARGEQERAISALMDALRNEPDLSQAAVAVAPLLAARGRLAELEAPILKALAQEQRLDEYQNLLGLIRLESGRAGEAVDAIGRALDVNPADARFLENFAAAAVTVGAPQLALERYRVGLADPRAGGAAWAGYGRLLGSIGRPREAASAFEKALSLGEKTPATYAGLATSLGQSGRAALSREAIEEGLRLFPGEPMLLAVRRSLEASLGRPR